MQKCTLALGCFWKPEENFKNQPGIIDTEVGYAGGENANVTYDEVCKGDSGHAEVVRLSFDEKMVSYEKILELFFKLHDPTQKDMQFPDVGTQYRSEIFYENESQKNLAFQVKDSIESVRLTESRRIKLNELHFFDHPLFGVILQVSRYETEE